MDEDGQSEDFETKTSDEESEFDEDSYSSEEEDSTVEVFNRTQGSFCISTAYSWRESLEHWFSNVITYSWRESLEHGFCIDACLFMTKMIGKVVLYVIAIHGITAGLLISEENRWTVDFVIAHKINCWIADVWRESLNCWFCIVVAYLFSKRIAGMLIMYFA